MKKVIIFLILIFIQLNAICQTDVKKFEPSGKISGQLFVNYHYDLTGGAEKKSQFEVLRSNFGYTYNFSEKFTGKIVMDAANDGKAQSVFLKGASLEWKEGMFTVEGGSMKTFMFDTQEDMWGNRYIMESLQDREKFYSPYDLGIKVAFKPSDLLQVRAGFFNGEGYKKLQDNFGVQRKAFDVIIRPVKELTLKAYYDFMPKRDTAIHDIDLLAVQSTANFSAGYDKPGKYRVGAEYSIQNSNGHRKDHSLYCVSAYGTLVLKSLELFARYDQVTSGKINGSDEGWNFSRDYTMLTGGVQVSPAKGIRTSLNYRGFYPENESLIRSDLIYLNLEVKF